MQIKSPSNILSNNIPERIDTIEDLHMRYFDEESKMLFSKFDVINILIKRVKRNYQIILLPCSMRISPIMLTLQVNS